MIHGLPDIHQPNEKRAHIAQRIMDALGDPHARPFYLLVAAKIPELAIRHALAEIKGDGARYPARVFTYRMQQYALAQYKQTLHSPRIQRSKKRL